MCAIWTYYNNSSLIEITETCSLVSLDVFDSSLWHLQNNLIAYQVFSLIVLPKVRETISSSSILPFSGKDLSPGWRGSSEPKTDIYKHGGMGKTVNDIT